MHRRLWLLLAALVVVPQCHAEELYMRAHFIDVGQGASTLLEFPCGAVLIDTGAQDDAYEAALGRYLTRFFERRSDLRNTLNALIISHPHVDHTRGIQTVLSACRVKAYIDGGIVAGSGRKGVQFIRDHAEEYQVQIREVKDEEIAALPSRTGLTDAIIDSITCSDCDPQIRILRGSMTTNPGWDPRDFDNLGNHSLVVRVDFGASSFLFTGDLEVPALETMLSYYRGTELLDVDVYLVGHHGSENGTTKELLDALSPSAAVIPVGKATFGAGQARSFNTFTYGHPRRATIDLLDAALPSYRNSSIIAMVAEAPRHFIQREIRKAIYATAWDGTVILRAEKGGRLSRDAMDNPVISETKPLSDSPQRFREVDRGGLAGEQLLYRVEIPQRIYAGGYCPNSVLLET